MKKKEGKLIGNPSRFIRKDQVGVTTATIGEVNVLSSEHVADLLDLSTSKPVVSSSDLLAVKQVKEVVDSVADVGDMTEEQKRKLMDVLEQDLRESSAPSQVAKPVLWQNLCEDPRLVAWLEFYCQPTKVNHRGKVRPLFRNFNVTGNTPEDFQRAVKATKLRMGVVDDPTGKYLDEAIDTGLGFYKGPQLPLKGEVRLESTIHPVEEGFLEAYTAQDRFENLMREFVLVQHDSIMKNNASHVLPRTHASAATSYRELSNYEWYMANLQALSDEDGFIVVGKDNPYPVLLDSIETDSEAEFAWSQVRRDVTRQELLRESALAPNQSEAHGGRSDSQPRLVVDNVAKTAPSVSGSEPSFQPLCIPDNSYGLPSGRLASVKHGGNREEDPSWVDRLYAEKARVMAERAMTLAQESVHRKSLIAYLEDLYERGCPYESFKFELNPWARQEAKNWLRDKLICRRATRSHTAFGESTVVTWEWARPVEYEFPTGASIQIVDKFDNPEIAKPADALARRLTAKLLNARAVDPNNRLFGLIYREVYRLMANEADLVGPPEPVYVYDDLITLNGEPRALLRVTSSWKITETGLWVPSFQNNQASPSQSKAGLWGKALSRARLIAESLKKSNGKKLPIQLATEVHVPGLGVVMVPLVLPKELQEKLNQS